MKRNKTKKPFFRHITDGEGAQWLLNKMKDNDVTLVDAIKIVALLGGRFHLVNIDKEVV